MRFFCWFSIYWLQFGLLKNLKQNRSIFCFFEENCELLVWSELAVWVIREGVTPGQASSSGATSALLAQPLTRSPVSKSGARDILATAIAPLPAIAAATLLRAAPFQTKTLAPSSADTGPWHSNAKKPLFPSFILQHSSFFNPILDAFFHAPEIFPPG